MVVADAFARVPTDHGATLATAIRAGRIAERAMVGGPISFDATGHGGGHDTICLQNIDGRPRVVLPGHLAERSLAPSPGR